MGMPEAPTYAFGSSRGRTNVTDPTGVDTAFDAGDTAVNTGFSWDVDTLLRIRVSVEQTNAIADVTADLATEFLIQYEVNGSATWNNIGAVGGGTEGVDAVASSGFADGDNTTTRLLGGSSTLVTGDSVETDTKTDTITFSTGSLSETEIEASVILNGGVLANDDTIVFRLMWDNGGGTPDQVVSGSSLTVTAVEDSAALPMLLEGSQLAGGLQTLSGGL